MCAWRWAVLSGLLLAADVQAAPPVLRLDQTHSGREFEVSAGAELTVELASDKASGLRWELLEPPISIVMRQRGDVDIAQASDKKGPIIRIQRWTFVAVGTGSQRLRFEQRRPAEVRYEPYQSANFLLHIVAADKDQSR